MTVFQVNRSLSPCGLTQRNPGWAVTFGIGAFALTLNGYRDRAIAVVPRHMGFVTIGVAHQGLGVLPADPLPQACHVKGHKDITHIDQDQGGHGKIQQFLFEKQAVHVLFQSRGGQVGL